MKKTRLTFRGNFLNFGGKSISFISPPEFIILVDTTNTGSASDTIQLPIRGTDMTIDWGDGFVQTEVTQIATPSFTNWITRVYPDGGGVKQIKITGLDWIYFAGTGDKAKLLEIQNWGTSQWSTMASAFHGCQNMTGTFTDSPVLNNVTNMAHMFFQASKFNTDLKYWNTSNVSGFRNMFTSATIFNGDISRWDVSKGYHFIQMFFGANNFNADLSGWNMINAGNLNGMFMNANKFNSDISKWNVGKVGLMTQLFQGASSFNQDLSGWCVSNITVRPPSFDTGANSWVYNTIGDTGDTSSVDPATIINRPVWGTCPGA